MRYLWMILPILFLADCASKYTIERHNTSFIRRAPQIIRIDNGEALPKGSFRASGSFGYSLMTPDIMQITDSSFEFRSVPLGDEFTIVNSLDSYWYESRLMLNGEGLYAVSNEFSVGVNIDASLGKVDNLPSGISGNVTNNNIDGTVFIRFAKQFGRWSVAIKPELLLAHYWGDRYWRETENGSHVRTATERVSFYSLNFRSASVLRYSLLSNLSPFIGVHIKSQPFLTADNTFDSEVAYGGYLGIECLWKAVGIAPYVVIPGGSTVSHYRSPVSAGILLSLRFIGSDDDL